MTVLIFSQIFFNFVVSVAVIAVSALVGIIAYELIKFIKAVKNLLNNLDKESTQIYQKINNFLEGFSNLSFISKFFNKKKIKK